MSMTRSSSLAEAAPGLDSSHLVQVRDVAVTYGGGSPVYALRGVDVDITRGERCVIVGPSGSGKSTLLNVIGLLEKPDRGSVVIDGVEATGLDDRAQAALRARSIGFVFQAFHLIKERSPVENLKLAMVAQGVPRGEREQRALSLLEAVHMGHRAHAPCGDLSGGERQRVAVARALTASPPLLLCDEPTGNLDSAASDAVLELLADQHARGVTVVVVTHDPVVATWAQRQITVRDGRIE